MSITDTSPSNSSRTSSPGSNLRVQIPKMKPVAPSMPPSNTLIISPAHGKATVLFDPLLQSRLEDLFRKQFSILFWNFSPYFDTLNIVFHHLDDAQKVKDNLNGEDIMALINDESSGENLSTCPIAISFGLPTHSDAQYLALPKLEKQFKLSPPPSPPAGYVQGIEDPPNKVIYAEDYELHSQELHVALKRAMTFHDEPTHVAEPSEPIATRGRSQSMAVVYHPGLYGSNPSLPSISVVDTDFDSPTQETVKEIPAHTSRPPVELMEF